MINKLQVIEWITLNLASLGWILLSHFEWVSVTISVLVGLSIVFLNIARGIMALKNKNDVQIRKQKRNAA